MSKTVKIFPSFSRWTSIVVAVVLISVFSSWTTGQSRKIQDQPSSWNSFLNGGRCHFSTPNPLPTVWSAKEGIRWKAELPGYGQSTPVVQGDSVFVNSVIGPNKEKNALLCLSRKTGEIKWKVVQPSTQTGPSNYMFSRAAPTPLADEIHAFAFFESGDLFAVDSKSGKLAWKRDLKEEVGSLKTRHGLGSSPAQNRDLIFVNIEHDGPSALLAISKKNGKTVWKAKRPSGSSWSSPIVYRWGTTEQVIVSSQGSVTGFNANTGKELWKIEGLTGNSVPSPTYDSNRVFLGARKSEFGSQKTSAKSNLCLEFNESGDAPKILWRSERCVTDYASPIAIGEFLFLIDKKGILACLEKESGKEIYRQRLEMECWATPVSDGTHLYLFGKDGTCVVLKPEDQFVKVSTNRIWDLKNPPKPISYQEHFLKTRHGHGHGHSAGKSKRHAGGSANSGQKPEAGMLSRWMEADQNGDGQLSGDEIPKRLKAVMENIDKNQDGNLDRAELIAMAKAFAARRKGSRKSSRDPIVYGVAADSEGFLIRTGTRLFAIDGVN